MTRKMLARTAVLALLALGLVSCGCREDEIGSADACSRFTDTLTQALTDCGMDTTFASYLCYATCGSACIEAARVEACTGAIRALGCERLSTVAVTSIESCSQVLDEIADDGRCGGFDDDDD
ncbi:MAG TPA: hypothetical protein DFS52_18920 [Myxococcales bacterium]|jgi:hypothetical protein|nr:hypothetical protein [Myxococcales bacterium]